MPRTARKASSTHMHHAILRGIDKRSIFLSIEDYTVFLEHVQRTKEKCNFSIYAFCLMTNHIHMLIKTENVAIGDVIKRITVGYVQYHNNKYGRSGHLFENRFKSEPVEDGRYFLTLLRYIHQNPVKAGLTKDLSTYPWSSYHAYTGSSNSNIVDTGVALESFPNVNRFKEFICAECEDSCMEYEARTKYTDEELYNIISQMTDIRRLQIIDTNSRSIEIIKIRNQTKASSRQLARVLGIGRGIIEKIK